PLSVMLAVPVTLWVDVPLNRIDWLAGNVRFAPLLVNEPARFSAPVMVEFRVTPLLMRRLPRTVSALAPAAVDVAVPAVRVSVRLPYVAPPAVSAKLAVPGTSYSNSPVSVPAADERRGSTPFVLRSVACT